jgi:hypothetical protein
MTNADRFGPGFTPIRPFARDSQHNFNDLVGIENFVLRHLTCSSLLSLAPIRIGGSEEERMGFSYEKPLSTPTSFLRKATIASYLDDKDSLVTERQQWTEFSMSGNH